MLHLCLLSHTYHPILGRSQVPNLPIDRHQSHLIIVGPPESLSPRAVVRAVGEAESAGIGRSLLCLASVRVGSEERRAYLLYHGAERDQAGGNDA